MQIKIIASKDNRDFKILKSLLRSRGIQEHRLAIVSGPKFIADALAARSTDMHAWVSFDGCEVKAPSSVANLKQLTLAKDLFDELDESGTKYPLLVVCVPAFASFDPTKHWEPGVHLFLPLQTPDNVGAVVRSAIAFGVTRIVLCKESANPYHPKALRTSGVTALKANFELGPAFAELCNLPVPTFALDMGGKDLRSLQFPKTFALIVGFEGGGIQNLKLKSEKISIPMTNGVESLNAAVATSLCLFQAYTP